MTTATIEKPEALPLIPMNVAKCVTEIPQEKIPPNLLFEPLPSPVTETVIEKGHHEIQLKVLVDDNVYCMQDKYHRPYTTVDLQGNTTVSVVEKVDVDVPLDGTMRATLHIKMFKNETVAVTPEANPNETCPIQQNLGSRLTQDLNDDLERNGLDEYDMAIHKTLKSYVKYVKKSVTNLRYTAAWDTDTTESIATTTTYLRPFIRQATNSTSSWYSYTNGTDTTYNHHLNYWYGKEASCYTRLQVQPKSALDRMREILQSRQAPAVIVRHTPVQRTTDQREIRARQTLRRLIGIEAYNRYLCKGFITYKGLSRVYQIFPGHKFVQVWENKKRVESMCVVLTGDFPPTDSVIMRFLLIKESEEKFRTIANVHPIYAPGNIRDETPQPILPLTDIFQTLKNQEERKKTGIFVPNKHVAISA